jgi:hypothetical protein
MSWKNRFLIAAASAALAFPAAAQDAPADPEQEAAQQTEEADTSATAEAEAGPVTAATAADVRAGIEVRDTKGGLVGTVESVDAEGAVVATGNVRAKLPFRSFGKNNLGLVISLTRAQLEAQAAAESSS